MDDEQAGVCRQVRPAPEEEPSAPAAPFLTRDDLFSGLGMAPQDLYVPEWDRYVRVRPFMGVERNELEALAYGEGKDPLGLRARIVGRALVDEAGERLVANEDMEKLAREHAGALDRIAAFVMDMNHLMPDSVERLVGNSGGDPNDGSGSS